MAARELQKYTIQKCVHFPKRYTFYIAQPITKMAMSIYNNVKIANSIYPLNKHEAQMRRDSFIRANAEVQALVSQVELAAEIFPISADVMKGWAERMDKAERMIKAVMKSDRERYKDLPE